MSGLAELGRRHDRLQDIGGILEAMKTLSLLETRKLARVIERQQRMRVHIEAAVADLLAWNPALHVNGLADAPELVVAIGAERGFCGRFDERVAEALHARPAAPGGGWIVVGQRLAGVLARGGPQRLGRVRCVVAGATVSEDIPGVLDRLLDGLDALQTGPEESGSQRGLVAERDLGETPARSAAAARAVRLTCLGHDARGDIVATPLLPLPTLPTSSQPHSPAAAAGHRDPPLHHLSAPALHAALLDEHVLTALQGHLATSLAAESHQRLAHMEQALDRLHDTMAHLAVRRHALRQERIVEEIEVILSASTLHGGP